MALAAALIVGPAAHASAATLERADDTAERTTGPAVPAPDANALLQAADEALERGDHAGAAEGFRGSYRALSAEQQRSPVGARTIALAYDAYREAWHRGRDPAPLRAARELLLEHITTLERANMTAAVQETRHRLEWIEHLLELEEASARAATPAACPEPPVQETPVCPTVEPEPTSRGTATPAETDAPPRRDVVGVALVSAGAVTLVGGVGLLIGGSRVLPTARQQIVAAGRDPDDPVPQDAVYLQVHQERGRNVMIAGGVVAGVGAAAATWGLVRLIRGRSAASRAKAHPVAVGVSPRGILLRARF